MYKKGSRVSGEITFVFVYKLVFILESNLLNYCLS